MQVKLLKYLSFALVLFVFACTKTETETQKSYLVSATFVKEFTKSELITALGSSGQQFAPFVKNGVKQYKIVYNTTNTDGTSIQASGAFIVPVGLTAAMPLVSYQHGTIFNDKDAPSYLTTTSSEGQIATLLASFGYITSAPDYIGYGASNNLPHTYEHREGLATASLDMLRAAKEAIAKENVNWNNSTYLSGYSEGGYATMSLQKKIEETTGAEFTLKAVSSGAGAYNKTQSFKDLVSTKSSGDSTHNASYIWVLLTYDRIYKFNRAMNTYFIEPYATQIQTQKQNARISGSFEGLLTTGIKKGITDGTDTALLTAVADNDVFDWKPKTPTRLYHGDKDTYVPYFNSVTAADAMKKRGADVELVTVAGGNHGSSISSFFLGTLTFFDSKK